jgi:hypothetical protein
VGFWRNGRGPLRLLAGAILALGIPLTAGAGAEVTGERLLEAARSAALEFAAREAFPPGKVAAIHRPPLGKRAVRLADDRPGIEFMWLGNGKGGGWFLHVKVDRASLETAVAGGYSEE